MTEIRNFEDFTRVLTGAGFSMGGGNSEGIFAAVPFDWNSRPPYSTPVCWHTGDPETDPWEWRLRVLEERGDIAYSKVFFKKSGYITREWYPYFLAARRGGKGFHEFYADGKISNTAKLLYEAISREEGIAVHNLKKAVTEEKARIESAIIELQMRLFITISGAESKIGADGAAYGWRGTAFCTTEWFWRNSDVFKTAAECGAEIAEERITARVFELNPGAKPLKIRKFIYG